MLLASSVHDIKNSLGMLLTTLDEVIDDDNKDPQQQKNYSVLRGEASRINQTLIHLLGLYRLQHNQMSVKTQQIYVREFLEEQVVSQQLLFDINDIAVSIDCDDELTAYFDEQLIAGIVNNVLVNAAKYTDNAINLCAKSLDRGLKLTISDNGNGYPQSVLDCIDNQQRGINFSSGSTNLGLYFAQQIANIHRCHDTHGTITLSNLEQGGGCFTLILP